MILEIGVLERGGGGGAVGGNRYLHNAGMLKLIPPAPRPHEVCYVSWYIW